MDTSTFVRCPYRLGSRLIPGMRYREYDMSQPYRTLDNRGDQFLGIAGIFLSRYMWCIASP